jgi:hypothetical protein
MADFKNAKWRSSKNNSFSNEARVNEPNNK